MIKLNERMNIIAEYIGFEEDIADIGTDHGYLPLFLIQQNPERKVIFTDVNEGPLKKTKAVIEKKYDGIDINMLDIRKGDGLAPIENGEVDVAVIAGMGGILIKEILERDKTKTRSFRKLILQPRTAADKLRMWLVAEGMFIYDETLAYEKGRICEIIAVNPKPADGIKNMEFMKTWDYEFSPLLINKGTPIVNEWIDRLLDTEIDIQKSIIDNGKKSSQKKLEDITERINLLSEIRDGLNQPQRDSKRRKSCPY